LFNLSFQIHLRILTKIIAIKSIIKLTAAENIKGSLLNRKNVEIPDFLNPSGAYCKFAVLLFIVVVSIISVVLYIYYV